jgi:hypothetical protein
MAPDSKTLQLLSMDPLSIRCGMRRMLWPGWNTLEHRQSDVLPKKCRLSPPRSTAGPRVRCSRRQPDRRCTKLHPCRLRRCQEGTACRSCCCCCRRCQTRTLQCMPSGRTMREGSSSRRCMPCTRGGWIPLNCQSKSLAYTVCKRWGTLLLSWLTMCLQGKRWGPRYLACRKRIQQDKACTRRLMLRRAAWSRCQRHRACTLK